MSERSMVTVLKTVVRKHRGFESLSLRQRPPGGGLALQSAARSAAAFAVPSRRFSFLPFLKTA